jgi:hypothetical protein
MRQILLAITATAAIMSAPTTVQAQTTQAQTTVGVASSSSASDGAVGIVASQRPAFRQYIAEQRVPNYTVSDRIALGAVLPETGIIFYDVPQSFGETPYRYTVVNGETVLVEPRSRRIVQMID